MPCTIAYIPERLHINNRPDLDEFFIGEFLFRRCPLGKRENPFDGISLVDLSVNRSGLLQEKLSEPEDVLFNMTPENEKGQILNEAVVHMRIAEMDGHQQYKKTQTSTKANNKDTTTNTCQLHLKHKKEECNYAHCAFEVYYNDVEMTYKNYDKLLKKDTVLRTWCKNEIAKMIVKEEVWINWPSEVNTESSANSNGEYAGSSDNHAAPSSTIG